MTDLRAAARDAAVRAGCDPELFVRQIAQESGFDPSAYNAGSGADGIAQIAGAEPAPSVQQLRTTDAVNLRAGPSRESAILDTLPRGTLVTPLGDHAWREVRTSNRLGWIAQGFLEAAAAPEPASAGLVYDPGFALQLQVQDWTCSIRTLLMMLASIGIQVGPADGQGALAPRWVNAEVGLLDASGAGLVAALGEVWGIEAVNVSPAGFAWVAERAGRMPIGVGARNWAGPGRGHWSAVRSYEDGRIVLANPAGASRRFGHASVSSADWQVMGPWSAVAIVVDSVR